MASARSSRWRLHSPAPITADPATDGASARRSRQAGSRSTRALSQRATPAATARAAETAQATAAIAQYDGPVYMRIGGPLIPDLFPQEPFTIGKGRIIRAGDRATLISTGTLTGQVILAADQLASNGIEVELIGMPTVEPIDTDLIVSSAARTGHVITIEEHYVRGGLSAAVAETIGQLSIRHDSIGLPHQHVTTGTYAGLLEHYGLDAKGLHDQIQGLLTSDLNPQLDDVDHSLPHDGIFDLDRA